MRKLVVLLTLLFLMGCAPKPDPECNPKLCTKNDLTELESGFCKIYQAMSCTRDGKYVGEPK